MRQEQRKRTWAEISLENIRYNYRTIRRTLPKGCRFVGVVKADAYGHGAVPVSRLLQEEGADYLAVSCLDEALELRDAGIEMPILILGTTPPEYTETLLQYHITQTVSSKALAEAYACRAAAMGQTLTVHIKVDTGMTRLGFVATAGHDQEAVEEIADVCSMPNLYCEGIFTHFAVSDELDEASLAYTDEQFALFVHMVERVEQRSGRSFALRHCANSGAVVNHPEMALDMVRPGILLYGYGGSTRVPVKPCMSLKTRISAITVRDDGVCVSYGRHYTTRKNERLGVLSIGYADGLLRCLSNDCEFACGGGFVPQRGNICMDMCMVDLSGVPQATVGDTVEIFGEKNDIRNLCTVAHTIPYELICSVSKRVPRVY